MERYRDFSIVKWYNNYHDKKGLNAWRSLECYYPFFEMARNKEAEKKNSASWYASWLDVGCGTGHLLKIVSENHYNTYGIDLSYIAIRIALKNCPYSKFKICYSDNLKHIKDGSMDVVTCIGVLEHTLNIPESFNEMVRALCYNGKLLIVVPNKSFLLWKFIKSGTNQKDVQEVLHNLPQWKKILSHKDLYVEKIVVEKSYPLKHKSVIRLLLKLFLAILPLRYTYQFCFIMRKI